MKNILIISAMLLVSNCVLAEDTIQRPATAILDAPNHLTPEQEKSIQSIIDRVDNARNAKAFLLVIDSLQDGQNILGYTKGIFKKWELNNYGEGLNYLIVYSRKDHAVRIEASDKVIQIVTRDYLQSVTTDSMMPYFRKRQDFEALKRGMEMVALKIENN